MRRRTLFHFGLVALAMALACESGSSGDAPGSDSPDVGGPDDASRWDGEAPDLQVMEATPDVPADQEPGVDAAQGEVGPDTGVDVPVITPCTGDEECGAADTCQRAYCDTATKVCVIEDMPDFTFCDLASKCQVDGRCKAGQCVDGLKDCDDHNPCTIDSCDPEAGCQHASSTDACDDGNPCTAIDQCAQGACVGKDNQCPCGVDADCTPKDDGDKCNGTLVCKGGFCEPDPSTLVSCPPAGADHPCQTNECDPATGQCVMTPRAEGTSCDDGDACTDGDRCVAGECKGTAIQCDDHNPCTDDTCDPQSACVFADNVAACDDGNGCTDKDQCKDGKCVGSPIAGGCGCVADAECAKFEDGNLCNGTLVCKGGQCVIDPKTVKKCDSSKDTPCLKSICDPTTGQCNPTVTGDGRDCDDGDLCTTASKCKGGKCEGAASLDCDDDNPCTKDSCNPATGCVHEPVDAPCETDTDKCTTQECQAGACVGKTVITSCVPDGNPCTDDACHADTGCYAPVADGTVCETDTDKCTTQECKAGQCVAKTVITSCVPDGNPCTDDACHPATGCYAPVADGTPCDDGNPCTSPDKCTAGTCVGIPDPQLCPPGCPPKDVVTPPGTGHFSLPVTPLPPAHTVTRLGVNTPATVPIEMVSLQLQSANPVGTAPPVQGVKVFKSTQTGCGPEVQVMSFTPSQFGGVATFPVVANDSYMVELLHDPAVYPAESFFDVFVSVTFPVN